MRNYICLQKLSLMKSLQKTVALIGFQSSGKTTLGRLLANVWQCKFVDIDHCVELFHPPLLKSDIFRIFGEVYFRQLESQVIQTLNEELPYVLATGGGSLLQQANREKLKEMSCLVYLQTSPSLLKERIWNRPSLPSYLSSDHPNEAFDCIYKERSPIYEKWADITIDMDRLTPEQALSTLVDLLEKSVVFSQLKES